MGGEELVGDDCFNGAESDVTDSLRIALFGASSLEISHTKVGLLYLRKRPL